MDIKAKPTEIVGVVLSLQSQRYHNEENSLKNKNRDWLFIGSSTQIHTQCKYPENTIESQIVHLHTLYLC